MADGVNNILGAELTISQNEHLENLGFNHIQYIPEHIKNLRTTFVLEASEWLAGKHGSTKNEKLQFGYTDKEWEWIWSSMIEDGAWAVPALTDSERE